MKTLHQLFLLPGFALSLFNASAQNFLMPDRLIINNQIQIIEGDYTEQYKNPLFSKNLVNEDLRPNNELSKIIGDFMLKNPSKCFNPELLFNENFYPVEIDSFNKVADFSVLIDSVFDEVRFNYSALKSLLFMEEWVLDAKAMTFSKKHLGMFPVRHYFRVYNDAGNNPAESQEMSISLAAFIPVKLASSTDLQEAKKRMIPVKKISYEFLLSDLHFLRWSSYSGSSGYLPDTGSVHFSTSLPYEPITSLYLNPLFSSYQVHQIRKLVYNKVFTEKIPVYSIYNDVVLSPNEIANSFGLKYSESGEFQSGEVVSLVDEFGNFKDYYIKADLNEICNRIYSIIFEEEWMIDPQSLYMEKKVKSITPVFWNQIADENEKWSWQKKTVFRMKMN